jgi:iron complex transport system permease protein
MISMKTHGNLRSEKKKQNNLKSRGRYATAFCFLCVLLLFFLLCNFMIGSVRIPLGTILDSLKGREIDSAYENILWQIRMPRALAAAILGGALGLSGYLLQTFFRNPIAGPFVLGISSGAKLAVALVMVFFLGDRAGVGSGVLILAAFVGALFSMGFVIVISGRVRSMSMLIVSGVMIGYICSAITDFVVTFAQDADIVNLHNWSMGSFSGITWDNVTVMSVIVLAATGIVFLLAKPIGAYQMGESFCVSMGVNLPRLKVLLVLLSSLLAACITAFAGPVSFVGIAVPHLVKQLFKTTKPIVMIPACFLGGSVFCLFCDLLARTLFAPTELNISTVTAVFGAPVVLAVMIRKKKAGE